MKAIIRTNTLPALDPLEEKSAPAEKPSRVVSIRPALPDLPPLVEAEVVGEKPKRDRNLVRPEQLPMPDFAPYFDPELGPEWERSREFGGYCLGVPNEDYHAWHGVSQGLLKHPTQAEMHWDMVRPRGDDFGTESSAEKFTTGTLLHWAVLEPWKFTAQHMNDHMVLSETAGLATKSNQEQRLEDPRLIVTQRHLEVAFRALEAVKCHPDASRLLGEGVDHPQEGKDFATEASGFVWDEENRLWRKIRVDLLRRDPSLPLIDVKTTAKPIHDFLTWEVKKNGYDFQAAWYMDTHTLLTGQRRHWCWIVVTKTEPFMCRVIDFYNRPPEDPLYDKSSLCAARTLIGLDPSPRLGRLFMWRSAAKDTLEARRSGVGSLSPSMVRSMWPGYEYEDTRASYY